MRRIGSWNKKKQDTRTLPTGRQANKLKIKRSSEKNAFLMRKTTCAT
jgi:hypothetical protein